MTGRALRIWVLLFTAIWFGVLVPVHQRGQIPVAGDWRRVAYSDDDNACCRRNASENASHDKPRKGLPLPVGRSCAVCQLIAGLDLPTPISFVLVPLAPAPQEPPPPTHTLHAFVLPGLQLARAPPAA